MNTSVFSHATDAPKAGSRAFTLCGLALALLGLPVVAAVFHLLPRTTEFTIARESLMWLVVAVLLAIVMRGEKSPLSSIGLRFDRPGRSIARGLLLALLVLAGTVGLFFAMQMLHVPIGGSDGSQAAFNPLLVAATMLRAGCAEEICYRGYAIERLQSLTGSRTLASLLPLAVFSASHYAQGIGGVVAVFVIGGILTIFYVRKRDLIANMIAHFVPDFVLNVILPLAGG